MPWSLSEGRHSGPFLRGDTQVSVWGEKSFSWRGNALVFLSVTLISFGEEMLSFLWEEMPVSVQGQMPWFISEGRRPALCLRIAAFFLVWEEIPWSPRMDTLLSVWENALVPFWGETPWSFSEKSCPGLCPRGEAMVLVWGETLWSLSEGRALVFLNEIRLVSVKGRHTDLFMRGGSWSLSLGKCSSFWFLFCFLSDLFIYYCQHGVFTAVLGLSLVAMSRGYSLLLCCSAWASRCGDGFSLW